MVSHLTQLLWHCENYTDSSLYPHIINNNGSTISSAQSRFGASSVLFSNSTSSFVDLGTQDSTDFWFNYEDFLISFWFYPLGQPTSVPQQFMGVWRTPDYCWRFTWQTSTSILFVTRQVNDTESIWANVTNVSMPNNAWYNLTLSKKENILRLWMNSTLLNSVTIPEIIRSLRRPTHSSRLEIGRNGDNAWPVDGYMDEILIVRGFGVDTWISPTTEFSFPLYL